MNKSRIVSSDKTTLKVSYDARDSNRDDTVVPWHQDPGSVSQMASSRRVVMNFLQKTRHTIHSASDPFTPCEKSGLSHLPIDREDVPGAKKDVILTLGDSLYHHCGTCDQSK